MIFVIATGNAIVWPKVGQAKQSFPSKVSVLIPARNEEANLASCLEAAIAQNEVLKEILVYDDHSSDHTGRIIKQYADAYPFIKLVPALPLPIGWCGKNYACAQLAKNASGDWLLFLDADARLQSNAVNNMVEAALAWEVTLLSSWPKFEMRSWIEKLLMPMLNFVVFSLYPTPLALLNRPQFQTNPGLGLGHGACMLFERKSYEEFGGHARVKDQIFEDTRISQLWRKDGKRGLCLDGQEVVHLRMYSTFSEICLGFQKNFYPAFQQDISFWLFLALHILVMFSPFVVFVFAGKNPFVLASVTFILLTRTFLAVRFHHSIISALLHPLGEVVLIGLGLSSWWKYKTGQGVAWKGREYPRGA